MFLYAYMYITDKGEKGGRGGRDDGGPDRTDSDWRRKEPGSSDSCKLTSQLIT